MNIIQIVIWSITALGIIATFVFNIISASRASRSETKDKATSIAVLNSDIGYVKSGIDDIKSKQSVTDEVLRDISTRVAKAEDNAKSAHKRIDCHEERIVRLEHEKEEG